MENNRAASLQKEAVDKATSTYWSDYFGEYGKMLVRKIPRKIKAGFEEAYGKRTAAQGERQAVVSIDIAPLAPPSSLPGGRVAFEGVLIADVVNPQGISSKVRRVFACTADVTSGEMVDFDLVDA